MEGAYEVEYGEDVLRHDIPHLDGGVALRIRQAIHAKLLMNPQDYSRPLRKPLSRHHKMRVGDYRVIFRVEDMTVKIFGIGHRKEIYNLMLKRLE